MIFETIFLNRKKEEIYRHLSLDVDSSKDCDDSILEKSLQQFFAQEKREIKCEKCEEGRLATQTMELIQKYVSPFLYFLENSFNMIWNNIIHYFLCIDPKY